jgi:hypothetical protein
MDRAPVAIWHPSRQGGQSSIGVSVDGALKKLIFIITTYTLNPKS